MNEFSIGEVKNYFHIYYSNIKDPILFNIRDLKSRELAFSFFDRVGMTRHTSFNDEASMMKFIHENVPQHFYYSSAYYENPSADMDLKKWKGADLIFDIDGDHIEGAERMKYSEMLDAVKKELNKLIILLRDDFNLNWNNMEIVFSGSRGYHVHVYDIFNDNESQERREIVDYITGKCTSKEYRLTSKNRWEKRIEENRFYFKQMIDSEKKWKDIFQKETGFIMNDIKSKRDPKLPDLIDEAARMKARKDYAALIDEPVTIDIHRLIRTPNSLHGKTGMRVLDINPEKVEDFNPLVDAIPEEFKVDKTYVIINKPTKLEILGEEIDLREGLYNLPLCKALFSVLKGNAEFIQQQ